MKLAGPPLKKNPLSPALLYMKIFMRKEPERTVTVHRRAGRRSRRFMNGIAAKNLFGNSGLRLEELEQLFHRRRQNLLVDRLGDVLIGALLHAPEPVGFLVLTAHHDDFGRRLQAF